MNATALDTLIDLLADIAAADYLREQASNDAAGSNDRTKRPLHDLHEAA